MLLPRIFQRSLKYQNCVKSLFSRKYTTQKTIRHEKQVKPYRDSTKSVNLKANFDTLPEKCDIAIIGGGGMGSSTAYFLKKRAGKDLNVVVIERDLTYSKASTPLSSGCLRQQFTVAENVMMSRYGAEFLHAFNKAIDPDIDPNFTCNGNLSLANVDRAESLVQNVEMQNQLGVKSEILTVKKLKQKFPWLRTDGVVLASFGCENEGWFDPWALLTGLRKKAQNLGVQYVEAEVVDFEFESNGKEYDKIDKLVVKTPNNDRRTIEFDKCILASGAYSGGIAKKAKIGTGTGLLATPLPIEPRKRYVYIIRSQGDNVPPLSSPFVLDISKVYFRRDGLGGNFISGKSPAIDREPATDNLDVDMEYFETDIWPNLAHRVPAFESLKVVGAWAGFYEYNKFDCNGVVGRHPAYDNFYIAAGFSGHGIQKIPAVGRAMSELIIDGQYKSIDLSLLNFERISLNKPIIELALA